MTALRDFLADWLAWAEAGGEEFSPAGHGYRKYWGLCSNAEEFWEGVEDQLDDRLDDEPYPFGFEEYEAGRWSQTQHQCPKRLAWVRKTIEELSE